MRKMLNAERRGPIWGIINLGQVGSSGVHVMGDRVEEGVRLLRT